MNSGRSGRVEQFGLLATLLINLKIQIPELGLHRNNFVFLAQMKLFILLEFQLLLKEINIFRNMNMIIFLNSTCDILGPVSRASYIISVSYLPNLMTQQQFPRPSPLRL